jgi:hypothetical protein
MGRFTNEGILRRKISMHIHNFAKELERDFLPLYLPPLFYTEQPPVVLS